MSDDDGPAFDPDDLDFTDDERVREIDEGRYVVSPNDRPPRTPPEADDGPAGDANEERTSGGDEPGREAVTSRDVSRWLASSFADDGFTYGFDATLSTDRDVVRHRLVSDDVTTTFETLLTWFATHAAAEAPPEEALGILLAAAETPVQFPPGTLQRYVDEHDLSPDDSIADLLAVAEAHGGLRVGGDPPAAEDRERDADSPADDTRDDDDSQP